MPDHPRWSTRNAFEKANAREMAAARRDLDIPDILTAYGPLQAAAASLARRTTLAVPRISEFNRFLMSKDPFNNLSMECFQTRYNAHVVNAWYELAASGAQSRSTKVFATDAGIPPLYAAFRGAMLEQDATPMVFDARFEYLALRNSRPSAWVKVDDLLAERMRNEVADLKEQLHGLHYSKVSDARELEGLIGEMMLLLGRHHEAPVSLVFLPALHRRDATAIQTWSVAKTDGKIDWEALYGQDKSDGNP